MSAACFCLRLQVCTEVNSMVCHAHQAVRNLHPQWLSPLPCNHSQVLALPITWPPVRSQYIRPTPVLLFPASVPARLPFGLLPFWQVCLSLIDVIWYLYPVGCWVMIRALSPWNLPDSRNIYGPHLRKYTALQHFDICALMWFLPNNSINNVIYQ